MTQIRYIPADPLQRRFAAAVRKNVNAYFKENGLETTADRSMVIKVLAMLSFYVVPFVVMLTLPIGVWGSLGMAVLMGAGMAGIGMSVMHDAVHGSTSSRAWLNKLLGSTMYLLGSNVFTWRIQHNIFHHTHTNIDEVDQDIESRGLLRFSEHTRLKWVHRFQHIHAFFFYGLLTITKLVNDFWMLQKFNKSGIMRDNKIKPGREFTMTALVKLAHVGVFIGLPLLLTPLTWWQVLLCFFIMHFVAGVILGTVFQLAHLVEGAEQPLPDDHGVIAQDWAVHELRTTANFAPRNALLNWYVGGLNFQIEHHLFPNICHVHYPHIAPIVQRTAEEFGLPYNSKPTFRAALLSHVRRMHELGHPPR